MVRTDVSARSELYYACLEQEKEEVKDRKMVDKKMASGQCRARVCTHLHIHMYIHKFIH